MSFTNYIYRKIVIKILSFLLNKRKLYLPRGFRSNNPLPVGRYPMTESWFLSNTFQYKELSLFEEMAASRARVGKIKNKARITAKTWKQSRCSSEGEWINCGTSK